MQLWLRVIAIFANAVETKKRLRPTRNSQKAEGSTGNKRVNTENVKVNFHFQMDWIYSHCWPCLWEHLQRGLNKEGRPTLIAGCHIPWHVVLDCFFQVALASESSSWGIICSFLVYFWASFVLDSQRHPYQNPWSLWMYLLAQKGDTADVFRIKDLDIMRWSWLSVKEGGRRKGQL